MTAKTTTPSSLSSLSLLLLLLLSSIVIIVCRDDDTNGNVTVGSCGSLTPENFLHNLGIKLIYEELPATENKHCFCNSPGSLYHKNICDLQCFKCDDNPVRCRVYGTCCPHIGNPPEVRWPNFRPLCFQSSKQVNYLLIRSCPPEYQNATIKERCEQRPFYDQINLTTDKATNVTYLNEYCAQCNGVNEYCIWSEGVSCGSFREVIAAKNETEFAKLALEEESLCKRKQFPCHGVPYECENRFFQRFRYEGYIDTCDDVLTPGQDYHPQVRSQCEEQPFDINAIVISKSRSFKNIFCLICNRQSYCYGYHPVITDQPPFQFMFGFNNPVFPGHSQVYQGCPTDQWMDPYGNCRQLVCSEGKVLISGDCQTALKFIRGLPYTVNFLLDSLTHQQVSGNDISLFNITSVQESVRDWIIQILSPFVKDMDVQIGVFLQQQDMEFTTDNGKGQSLLPRFVWVNVLLLAKIGDNYPRDKVEKDIYLSLYKNPVVDIAMRGSFYNSSFRLHFVYNSPELFDYENPCRAYGLMLCYVKHFIYNDERSGSLYGKINGNYRHQIKSRHFLDMHPYLAYPHIELPADNVNETIYPWPVPHVTKLTIRFGNDSIIELTDPHEKSQVFRNGDVFYICLQLLNSKKFRVFPLIKSTWTSSLFDKIQYVLTCFCVTASLLCLSATVITLCLFPSLRYVAGCNTLGLSSSLMIAQVLLMVAHSVSGPSVACTVLGVAVHYSWLVMFTWTFLCCLHMMRVFTSHQLNASSTNKARQKKTIAFNVTASLLVPALIVVIVVVSNVLTYGRTRIGYGYTACTVDNVFTIHGPLIFVTISNVVFFVVVVCQIWSTRRLQQNNNEFWDDFVVYIKLSTLTGVFWLLVILGEVFQNDVIRILAVLANGCQGVFIFASFTANRRILNHYKEKFNPELSSSGQEAPDSSSRKPTSKLESCDDENKPE